MASFEAVAAGTIGARPVRPSTADSMLLQYLEALRAHGEWSDARLLAAVRNAERDADLAADRAMESDATGSADGKPVGTASASLKEVLRELAHVRGAQELWLSRIEGRAPTMAVFPEFSADELEQAARGVDAGMRTLIAQLDETSAMRVIEYRNLAGAGYGTPILEILMQLLTHGHYHRGKANVALKVAGVTPVSVDYIGWQREMAAAK